MAIFTLQDVRDGKLFVPEIVLPSYVAGTSASFASSSASMSTPSGMLEGDLLILSGGHTGTGTAAWGYTDYSGDGWSSLHTQRTTFTNWIGYNVMGASPLASISPPNWAPSSTINGELVMAAFRNAGTPVITTASVSTSGTTTSPAVTTTVDGSVVVIGVFIDEERTLTPPAGYTTIAMQTGFGYMGTSGLAYKVIDTAGTETPGAWSWSAGAEDSQAFSIVIPPAA